VLLQPGRQANLAVTDAVTVTAAAQHIGTAQQYSTAQNSRAIRSALCLQTRMPVDNRVDNRWCRDTSLRLDIRGDAFGRDKAGDIQSHNSATKLCPGQACLSGINTANGSPCHARSTTKHLLPHAPGRSCQRSEWMT
jgi:hypothetical protein